MIVKTRSERSMPPIVVASGPEPAIVTSSVIASSPAFSWMRHGPDDDEVVSATSFALAALIAERSVGH